MTATSVIRTAARDSFLPATLASGIGLAPFGVSPGAGPGPMPEAANGNRRWPLLLVVGGRASAQ